MTTTGAFLPPHATRQPAKCTALMFSTMMAMTRAESPGQAGQIAPGRPRIAGLFRHANTLRLPTQPLASIQNGNEKIIRICAHDPQSDARREPSDALIALTCSRCEPNPPRPDSGKRTTYERERSSCPDAKSSKEFLLKMATASSTAQNERSAPLAGAAA